MHRNVSEIRPSTFHSCKEIGLAFSLEMCNTINQMKQPPSLETAEEKAKRRWHNGQVLTKIRDENVKPNHISTTQHDEPAAIARAFKKAIHEVFETNKNNNIMKYIAAIRHQKQRLLQEKLRRIELERNNAES